MNTIEFIQQQTQKILAEDRVQRKHLGNLSRVTRGALGLAESNPKQLLQKIGIPTNKKQTLQQILQRFLDNDVIGEAFNDDLSENRNSFEMSIKILEGDNSVPARDRPAISPYQAPRYIKATIIAAKNAGVLDTDPESIKYLLFEEDESKFIVQVQKP
jgi:hypothetical protein